MAINLTKRQKSAIILSIFLVSIIVLSLQPVYSSLVTTVSVPPGTSQSIVLNLNSGDKVTGTITVAGGAGNGINFMVKDPSGNATIPQKRVSGGSFDFTATSSGAYNLYFDNSFSTVNSTQVILSYDIAKSKSPFGGRCLIATAAFGSEFAPQVQFLREFRDNSILATKDGSSFINVFNAWYYSFSPYVADYERSHTWFQQIVRNSIYPLLGILATSQKAYSIIPGDFGSLSAGLIASSMIGAIYFWPFALPFRKVRNKSSYNYKLIASIIGGISIATIGSVFFGNPVILAITTSLFVLALVGIFAMFSAKALVRSVAIFSKQS